MALGMEVGLVPGHIALDGDPASLRKGPQPHNFRPMSIVAKRSPISATAEHLYKRLLKNKRRYGLGMRLSFNFVNV